MATIYTYANANIRRTWLLMSLFFVLLIAIFWLFSYAYQNPAILWFGVLLALVMNIASFWYSDKIVLAMSKARPIKTGDNPELCRIVENLAIAAGLPAPKLYVVDDPAPNAFATGRDKNHAAIAVTRGLLERLNRTELEGVIAHEISHIGNRDMLIATAVVVLAGIIAVVSDMFLRATWWGGFRSRNNDRGGGILMALALIGAILAPFAATLIRLAISRRREFLADASGALLTRYPEGLASALEKIAADPRPMTTARTATAHLYFENPFKADAPGGAKQRAPWIVTLFMTHPPVEDRVRALRGMSV